MEIDKLTSPIKKEIIKKEREIESRDKKCNDRILNLKALYESYYYEKQHSMKHAYSLSIQTEQFSFEVFIAIIGMCLMLVVFLIHMFNTHIDIPSNNVPIVLPMLISLVLIFLGTIVYFFTGFFLKANLAQPNIQRNVSEYILETMVTHELISKEDLNANGIQFKVTDKFLNHRTLEFTYNNDISDMTEKPLLTDGKTQEQV